MARGTWSMVLAAALAACDAEEAGEVVQEEAGGEQEASAQAAAAGPQTGGEAAPLGPARDTVVTYLLAWSWEGARREGEAWVFETDLGYTVGIVAAHVATSQIALVPCAEEAADEQGAAGTIAAWAADLVVGTAHAAHGGTPDASTAAIPVAESWMDEGLRVFGAAKASGAEYCDVHVISAPLEGVAEDGQAFAGETLLLSGFWSAPGEAERHGLQVSVNLSDGRVRPLGRLVGWPAEASSGEVAVVIERRPARAFDGLVLEELSEVELAFEVLGGVLYSAEVTVARRDGG